MRKYHKKLCIELLSSLEQTADQAEKLVARRCAEDAARLLEDCQQGAIKVGSTIEELEGEGTEAVRVLEEYCEAAYQLHERLLSGEAVNARQSVKKLRKLIYKARNAIENQLSTQYEIVFFPYKASMWDSLESIWMAADADPDCTAYVVPIPYFDRNPDGSFKQMHDEAGMYPPEVPVVRYKDYNVAERHPDVIYIHSPYDGSNYVTSVHPDYYSDVLKQYTDCLVYVPYYSIASVPNGTVQSFCPAFQNVDYMVVQSPEFIPYYEAACERKKLLPLGSPKFDRIIRMCKNPPEPPAEWKEKMAGKRVFFFNTSIAGMLADTETFLRKLRYVFETVLDVEGTCLLWRPHPLLQATFESMRPQFLSEYESLKRFFIEKGIGIFDTSSDIEASIAWSDAYIGDAGTSVTSLFSACCKPIYILDHKLLGAAAENWWRGSFFYCPIGDDRYNRYIVMWDDMLFRTAEGTYDYRFVRKLPRDKHHRGYILAFQGDELAYVFPGNAQNILVLSDGEIADTIELPKRAVEENAFSRAFVHEDRYAFLIPDQYPDLVRADLQTREIALVNGFASYNSFTDHGVRRYGASLLLPAIGKLAVARADGTEISLIDVETLKLTRLPAPVGQPIVKLQVVASDCREVWLFPYQGTVVWLWNTENNTFSSFDLALEGQISVDRESGGPTQRLIYCAMVQSGDQVIFTPEWGIKFAVLDRSTGKVSEWRPFFPVYLDDVNEYYRNFCQGWFTRDLNCDIVGYFCAPERQFYSVDMEARTYKPVPVNFDGDEISRIYAHGFTDEVTGAPYAIYENDWNDLKRLVANRFYGDAYDPEIARERFASINTGGGDGKSGERIHRYIKDMLG